MNCEMNRQNKLKQYCDFIDAACEDRLDDAMAPFSPRSSATLPIPVRFFGFFETFLPFCSKTIVFHDCFVTFQTGMLFRR
jgi:hypothetical protein